LVGDHTLKVDADSESTCVSDDGSDLADDAVAVVGTAAALRVNTANCCSNFAILVSNIAIFVAENDSLLASLAVTGRWTSGAPKLPGKAEKCALANAAFLAASAYEP
jgi:hypothetical protein